MTSFEITILMLKHAYQENKSVHLICCHLNFIVFSLVLLPHLKMFIPSYLTGPDGTV